MEPYRTRIDMAVEWLILLDEKTGKTDNAFREELREKEKGWAISFCERCVRYRKKHIREIHAESISRTIKI